MYFSALAVIIGFAVRYVGKSQFTTTPLDYLVIFIALASGILLNEIPGRTDLGYMAIKLIILFYGCELVTMHTKRAWNMLNISTVAVLVMLSARGLF